MTLRKKMLVSLFAALLSVSSYLIIPLGPMPVTLQVLFVLLAGNGSGREAGADERSGLDCAGGVWLAGVCRRQSGTDCAFGTDRRLSAWICPLRLGRWRHDPQRLCVKAAHGCGDASRNQPDVSCRAGRIYGQFRVFSAAAHDVAASPVDRGAAVYTGRSGQSGPRRLGVADPDRRPQPGRNHGAVAGAGMMRPNIGRGFFLGEACVFKSVLLWRRRTVLITFCNLTNSFA